MANEENRMFLVFDCRTPSTTYIFTKDTVDELGLEELDNYYIHEITPIQQDKKSLLANSNEDAAEYVDNITNNEWIQLLRSAYSDMLTQFDIYGDAEEVGPLYLHFNQGDEGTELEESFIEFYNNYIENSEIINNSYQYRWYTYNDINAGKEIFKK